MGSHLGRKGVTGLKWLALGICPRTDSPSLRQRSLSACQNPPALPALRVWQGQAPRSG